ncbi:MAG: flagellar biosynthetic protein FliR [Calditrichia bacterium]
MFLESQIYYFFLIFIRTTTFISVAPFFGDNSVNRMVKIGLGGLLALAVYPVATVNAPMIDLTLVTIMIAVGAEILVGLIIGFMLQFIFAAAQMGGEYIGMDMGLAMATQMDPNFNQQISIIGTLFYLLTLMAFILLEGHLFLIQAFSFSYIAIPVASIQLTPLALDAIIKIAGIIFVIAVKIAAPAIVALFLASIAMGISARAVPQMNIFFVGIPLRIGAGLFAIILSLPLFFYVFEKVLLSFENQLDNLIRAM